MLFMAQTSLTKNNLGQLRSFMSVQKYFSDFIFFKKLANWTLASLRAVWDEPQVLKVVGSNPSTV